MEYFIQGILSFIEGFSTLCRFFIPPKGIMYILLYPNTPLHYPYFIIKTENNYSIIFFFLYLCKSETIYKFHYK